MKHYLIYALYAVCMLGCLLCSRGCIFEWPDEDPIFPPEMGAVDVSISIDLAMSFGEDNLQTYAPMADGNYDMRYVVDVYKTEDMVHDQLRNRRYRLIATESCLTADSIYNFLRPLTLEAELYTVLVWVDFVRKGTNTDLHYNTADLQSVQIIADAEPCAGEQSAKDAFAAAITIDLRPYDDDVDPDYWLTIHAQRPLTSYKIVATDLQEYCAKTYMHPYDSVRPYATRLLYSYFFPMGYDVYHATPTNYKGGVNYRYAIGETFPQERPGELDVQREVVIASDYVFVSDSTFFYTNFEILTPTGKVINTIRGLSVIFEKNQMTIVKDDFLTQRNGGMAGGGINDKFDDETVLWIP